MTLLDQTDDLLVKSELLLNQAEVLELAGRVEDAKVALTKAVEAAARKGAVLDVARATERLTALDTFEQGPLR
jgi:hypothetical protein